MTLRKRRAAAFAAVLVDRPLPRLLLPLEVEARLPEGLDRGQLLSVLWRTGALRPGQVSVQLGETENKGAVPEIRAFCP